MLVSRLRGVLDALRLVYSDAGSALLVDWLDLDALAAGDYPAAIDLAKAILVRDPYDEVALRLVMATQAAAGRPAAAP